MERIIKIFGIGCVLILMFNCLLYSQQDTVFVEIVEINLTDGSSIVGNIIEENDSSVTIKTLTELEIKIPKNHIVTREIIKGQIEDGEFWHSDPNKTRMLFAPTGKGLKAGEGYFSVYEIFFPFIAVGVTDWFTLAGGMSLVPGAESQVFYLAPKITPIQVTNFDASLGVLYMAIPDEEAAGIAYAVGTYGTEKASLTLGLGYGFSGGDFAANPVIVLGGDVRVSRSVKLISENWIILSGNVNVFSFGIRFFGENLAADFALLFSSESTSGFPFLPWLGFAYNF